MSSTIFERIKYDDAFRIKLFLILSFSFNVVYSIFLFVISQIYSSKWFFVMSIYYGLLSVVRNICLFQINTTKKSVSKIKILSVCSVFLLLINLVVSTMMFILIHENQAIKYHEIIVIGLATYTFTSLTIAIINCVKYIRKKDYIFSCIKVISLTTASVSMVTLTNTMLATWGGNNTLLRSIILPILSGVVSIFIIACAIIMMVKSNLDLRKSKK